MGSNITRRAWAVYAALALVWVLIFAWQVAEHVRVRKSARIALVNRAKDISNTVGFVMRSQGRYGGVISQGRIESALKELIDPRELSAIALLNAEGAVVASAGDTIDLHGQEPAGASQRWEDQKVTLLNLVDLGTNVTREAERPNPTIVLPRSEMMRGSSTNRPLGPPAPPPPRPEPDMASGPNESPDLDQPPPPPRGRRGGPREGRPWFGRPFWMSEEDYKALLQKQGVHSFVLVLSTQGLKAVTSQDFWLRSIIVVLAGVSVLGSGLAWRTLAKTSELQIRLVRASESNTHLKEMNLAAAGLAHETRNPLNIIRSLAQMISKQDDATTEIRRRSCAIIEETDRVTAQLNEFINYSRPREVRPTAVAVQPLATDVVRALSYDLEEKNIQFEILGEPLVIQADEQLLRQAMFNLVLNAIQAVAPGGNVQIRVSKNTTGATLDIADNGPGVPGEQRTQIFKPYYTTHQKGTGLGLAVVQQIVLAHGWEIECLANEPKGALFRVKHLKLAGKN